MQGLDAMNGAPIRDRPPHSIDPAGRVSLHDGSRQSC